MGFGKTVERFETTTLKFTLSDFFTNLHSKDLIIDQLKQIANHYKILIDEEFYSLANDFYDKLLYIDDVLDINSNPEYIINGLNSINIFEGDFCTESI